MQNKLKKTLMICVLLLAGCSNAPSTLSTPTPILTSTPGTLPTRTPKPTYTPVLTQTVTPALKTLSGLNVIYWCQEGLCAQGLEWPAPTLYATIQSKYHEAMLSPDGTMFAFIDNERRVATYNLETGEVTTYTQNPDLNFIKLSNWSPDSQMFLYTTSIFQWPAGWDPFGIYLVTLETGEVKCLLDWDENFDQITFRDTLPYGGCFPNWSPDGKWIVFSKLKSLDLYVMDAGCINNPINCIKQSQPIGFGSQQIPTWSPQNQLTFHCTIEGQSGPCVMDLNSSESPHLLMNIDAQYFVWGYHWSPDGNYLAYTALQQEEGGSYYSDVYVVSAHGDGNVVNITHTPDMNEEFNGWSPDSKYITFTRIYGWKEYPNESFGDPLGDIFVVPVGSWEPVNLTNSPNEVNIFAFWVDDK